MSLRNPLPVTIIALGLMIAGAAVAHDVKRCRDLPGKCAVMQRPQGRAAIEGVQTVERWIKARFGG